MAISRKNDLSAARLARTDVAEEAMRWRRQFETMHSTFQSEEDRCRSCCIDWAG